MKRRLPMIAFVLALANLVGAAEPAKEPAAKGAMSAKVPSPAELAVRKAAADFDQAFNAGSADKIAGLWTADAEYIDEDGQRYVGRDVIKREYADFFAANPQSKISSVTDSVRVINDSTAIEDGRAMIQPPPAARRVPAVTRRSTCCKTASGCCPPFTI